MSIIGFRLPPMMLIYSWKIRVVARRLLLKKFIVTIIILLIYCDQLNSLNQVRRLIERPQFSSCFLFLLELVICSYLCHTSSRKLGYVRRMITKPFFIAFGLLIFNFISGFIAVYMLMDLKAQVNLGSYQEVAYYMSGQRSTIMGISLLFAFFFAVNCSVYICKIKNILICFQSFLQNSLSNSLKT